MYNIILILLCSLVTAVPKIIPLKYLKGKQLSRQTAEFLNIIPYTSLSIMVIRGILTASSEMLIPTIVASIVAIIIAYLKENVGLTIILAVLTAFVCLKFSKKIPSVAQIRAAEGFCFYFTFLILQCCLLKTGNPEIGSKISLSINILMFASFQLSSWLNEPPPTFISKS